MKKNFLALALVGSLATGTMSQASFASSLKSVPGAIASVPSSIGKICGNVLRGAKKRPVLAFASASALVAVVVAVVTQFKSKKGGK